MGPAGRDERWWPAPAKLNLMLRVLGRREDGYHRLQTVFQFLDRCDLLAFLPRADGQVRRARNLPGVSEDRDLTVRAARLLQRRTGRAQGVDIHLDKRLPLGGGLGGGSSDAATTLVALNHLWGTGLRQDELAALGLTLGADVPVFVHGYAAWGEGVGEELTPIQVREDWYLVVVPSCEVSTASVFADPGLTRNSPAITIADFVRGDARNDCVAVVRRRYPPVERALAWLGGFGRARLTGTGACCFAAFAQEKQAHEALSRLPPDMSGFVARGLNRSPLLDRVQPCEGR